MFRLVEFPSEGVTLRGRLYAGRDRSGRSPVVVMAHGFSATINGMVADRYAERFAEAGLAVLLFDHRNFGLSGGEPRCQINRWTQARGYRDAVSFATGLAEIDGRRVALWGDSMSGGEVVVAGAIDRRVKAVVAQVPACGEEPPPPDPDGSRFAQIRETLLHGDVSGTPQTTVGPLPVVSFDQRSIASLLTPLTAFRWFIEYGGRHGTGWENSATLVMPATPAPFHPGLCAPHLAAALLMMVAGDDEMPGANPEIARAVYAAAPAPKALVELSGGHFGLLHHPGPWFERASREQTDFLTRHLQLERNS